MDLTGTVNSYGADVAAASLTADMLAAAVARGLCTATLTVGDRVADDITVTLAAGDAQGAAMTSRALLWLWLSTAPHETPTVLPTGGAPTVSTGACILAMTASKPGLYQTDDAGALVLVFTQTAVPLGLYIAGLMRGLVLDGSQRLTWIF
jgi:hypothetical protein